LFLFCLQLLPEALEERVTMSVSQRLHPGCGHALLLKQEDSDGGATLPTREPVRKIDLDFSAFDNTFTPFEITTTISIRPDFPSPHPILFNLIR
jgi:hypothetical protein